MICKEFPSVNGVNRFPGTISKIILYRSEKANAVSPVADILKNNPQNAVPTTPTATETIKKRPIIFFPIFPNVDISPIPSIPQTTERKIIGPEIADNNPINVLNTGVINSPVINPDTFCGSKLHKTPSIAAAKIAMPICNICDIFFFFAEKVMKFFPFLYRHTGARPRFESSLCNIPSPFSSSSLKGSKLSPETESSILNVRNLFDITSSKLLFSPNRSEYFNSISSIESLMR